MIENVPVAVTKHLNSVPCERGPDLIGQLFDLGLLERDQLVIDVNCKIIRMFVEQFQISF